MIFISLYQTVFTKKMTDQRAILLTGEVYPAGPYHFSAIPLSLRICII